MHLKHVRCVAGFFRADPNLRCRECREPWGQHDTARFLEALEECDPDGMEWGRGDRGLVVPDDGVEVAAPTHLVPLCCNRTLFVCEDGVQSFVQLDDDRM